MWDNAEVETMLSFIQTTTGHFQMDLRMRAYVQPSDHDTQVLKGRYNTTRPILPLCARISVQRRIALQWTTWLMCYRTSADYKGSGKLD